MSATTDSVTQPQQSQPSPKNVQKTFWTDSQGDAQLDALAALNDCSQGALLRSLVNEAFAEQFDDLDPAHIEQDRVSVEDLHALANEELTVDDLDLTSDTPEPVAEYESNSYYLTVTPDDLAEPGPELDWEILRAAVENPEDGGYWNDELEIHESRVDDTTLKASHRPAARILTGLARSNAYENGIVPQAIIDELVETYCLHLTNRVTDDERESGRDHIHETYTSLVADQLHENPSPTAASYFCTKAQLQTRLQAEVDTAQQVAHQADTITDFETWQQKQTTETSVADADELRRQWHTDLLHWVTSMAQAKYVGRTYATELRRNVYDVPEANETEDEDERMAADEDEGMRTIESDETTATAFDALHTNLHDARTAFDTLPAAVKVEIIDALDDTLLAAIRPN